MEWPQDEVEKRGVVAKPPPLRCHSALFASLRVLGFCGFLLSYSDLLAPFWIAANSSAGWPSRSTHTPHMLPSGL